MSMIKLQSIYWWLSSIIILGGTLYFKVTHDQLKEQYQEVVTRRNESKEQIRELENAIGETSATISYQGLEITDLVNKVAQLEDEMIESDSSLLQEYDRLQDEIDLAIDEKRSALVLFDSLHNELSLLQKSVTDDIRLRGNIDSLLIAYQALQDSLVMLSQYSSLLQLERDSLQNENDFLHIIIPLIRTGDALYYSFSNENLLNRRKRISDFYGSLSAFKQVYSYGYEPVVTRIEELQKLREEKAWLQLPE